MALINTVKCLLSFIEYFVMSNTSIESPLRLPILGNVFELKLTLHFIETKTKVKCCVNFSLFLPFTIQKVALVDRMTFVVIHGSEPLTKLRRKCSSGQTKKTWNSQTGIQLNQTTPMAMKTVFHCVVMVNGMITIVTKLSTSSVKDMFSINLFFS